MELVGELKEIISLNKSAALLLTKEYLKVYLVSLIKDYNGVENRKILIEKLKEYYATVREENDYMRFLLDNLEKVTDYEMLDKLLDDLDLVNEMTYLYYDKVLMEYEDNMFYGTLERKIVPVKDFKSIVENSDYLNTVLELVLSAEKFQELSKGDNLKVYLRGRMTR